jgi:hypothetical protein
MTLTFKPQTEFCSSTNLMSNVLHSYLMPVDRELAYESLEWADPQIYRAYLRMRYRNITEEEFEKDRDSLCKVYLTQKIFDSLDSAEDLSPLPVHVAKDQSGEAAVTNYCASLDLYKNVCNFRFA